MRPAQPVQLVQTDFRTAAFRRDGDLSVTLRARVVRSGCSSDPAGSESVARRFFRFNFSFSLRSVGVLAIVVTALAAIRNQAADPDLWGHIQYGREVLATGTLPEASTWTFATSAPWINHENLAEFALAWVNDRFGAIGLGLTKLALTLAILAAMLRAAIRRGATLPATAVVIVLAAECMQFHWHFRPHLFGFALFAALMAHLDWCFASWEPDWLVFRRWWRTRRPAPNATTGGGRPPESTWSPQTATRLRYLWPGPLILCLWTNTHGSFMAGLAIWCTVLTLRIVEARGSRGTAANPVIRRLAVMIVAGILATCLNPYGPALHVWLINDVRVPRPEITDWQPMAAFGLEMWSFWVLLGLAGLSLWRTRHRFSLTETVVLVLITSQALAHVRHALFFAILCGFWLPDRLTVVLRYAGNIWLPSWKTLVGRPAVQMALSVLAMLWTAGLATVSAADWTTVRVDRGRYPVEAMRYLFAHRLFGRTIVHFNWAQYAIGCFGTDPVACRQARVAVDGRLRTCYPQEIIDLYLDLFLGDQPPEERYRSPHSPDCDPDRALDWKSPDLLLIERHNPHCQAAVEQRRDDWVLLYQDRLAQIWGRRNRYDSVDSPDFVPLSLRRIGDAEQRGVVAWPATPPRSPSFGVSCLLAEYSD